MNKKDMFIISILLLLFALGCESNIQENHLYFPQPWKNWTYPKAIASKGTVRIMVERFLVQKEVELILETRFDYPRLNLLSPRTYVPGVSICSFIHINEEVDIDNYGIIRSKFGPPVENEESSYIIWSIGPDLISNVTVMSRSSLNSYSFKPENQTFGIMHFMCVKLFTRRLKHTIEDTVVELFVDGVKAPIGNRLYENSSLEQSHLIKVLEKSPYTIIGCFELEERCGTWETTLPRISTDVTEQCCQLKECDQPCPARSTCMPDLSPPFRTRCQCLFSVKEKTCDVQQENPCTYEENREIQCENGGTCVSAGKSSKNNTTCLCEVAYFGDRCEKSFLNYRGAIDSPPDKEIPESEHSNITSRGLPFSFMGVVKLHQVNLTANNSAVHIYLEREYKGFSILMTWTHGSPPKWKDFFSTDLVVSRTNPKEFLLTLLPERNLTRKTGRHYVGLVPYTEEVRKMLLREKDNRTFDPSHLPEDMDYNITIFMSSCQHQGEKKEGCKVTIETTIDSIACDCQHLETSMARFETESETYTVFWVNLLGNPVILCSMSVVWVLFLLSLPCMIFLDKSNVKKNPIIYLNDHIQKGGYGYLLMFRTGFRRKAGTTSNVSVKLHGSRNVTDAIPLCPTDSKIFQRGDEDWFYFTENIHFSDIIGLTILVEFKKDKPNWYLSQVRVKDLKTHKYWVFLVNDWFLPEGRWQVEDYFIPLTQSDKSFKELWKWKAKNELRNRYMFLSFFHFPSRTQFSRAQRLATTFSTYLLSISITTYWYFRQKEQTPETPEAEMQLLVATCSTLMALVYEIILIELFLNIKKPEEALLHTLSKKYKKRRKKSSSMLPSSSSSDFENIDKKPSQPYPQSPGAKSRIFNSREDNFTRTPTQYTPNEAFRCKSFCDDLFLPTDMQKPRPMLTAANFTPPRDHRALQTLPVDMGIEEQQGRQCHLPRGCLFPLWCLVWGVSAACTVFTLLNGLQLDYEASVNWLLSNVFALALEVLLCQPLYALVAMLIISCFSRRQE